MKEGKNLVLKRIYDLSNLITYLDDNNEDCSTAIAFLEQYVSILKEMNGNKEYIENSKECEMCGGKLSALDFEGNPYCGICFSDDF